MDLPALTRHDEDALQALISWWTDAGIPLDEPIMRPRPGVVRSSTPPQSRPAAVPSAPARPAAATAAAAKAAGFGETASGADAARQAAAAASDLASLKTAIEAFEGCPLKRTARTTVFARGNPDAKLMIVGEAPGRDEDAQGVPFVGRSGQLLDRMFAAIGLTPDDVYITNIVNWRPPGNRNPTQEEIATCLPFIERHIALKQPDFLVLAGGVSAQSLLRTETGITRLRGQWSEYTLTKPDGEASGETRPALAFFHPSYLLRRPFEKRLAWQDLLAIRAKIAG